MDLRLCRRLHVVIARYQSSHRLCPGTGALMRRADEKKACRDGAGRAERDIRAPRYAPRSRNKAPGLVAQRRIV